MCFCYTVQIMTTGVDINRTRLDDLDRIIIRDSLAEPFEKQIICNFGSGASMLSSALAGLGHRVYNYDNRNLHTFFALQQEQGNKVYFQQIHLQKIKRVNLPKQYNIVVAQRVLHYLKYTDAQKFLMSASRGLASGGTVYMSLTGIESAIAYTYDQKDAHIEKRWGALSAEEQEKFDIKQPVCLYSLDNAQQLIDSIDGLQIEKIWQSQFGNIKVVAIKK